MSEHDPTRQDPSSHPQGPQGRGLRCEEWESLIADALDQALPAPDAAAFERHHRECAACAQMLEEARQGIAWLGYLENEPAPPAGLLAKILARTSGSAATVPAGPAKADLVPVPPFRGWYRTALPAARRMIEPRLWMTAAMAFFSIALTLNLTGIRLSAIRLADLRPSVVLTNVSRRYYSTKEEGVKYYDNLRFVYEMEARVRELRRSQAPAPSPGPEVTPRPQSPSSRNAGPGKRGPRPREDRDSLAGSGQPALGGPEIRTPKIGAPGTPTQAERSLA
jgi:Putative zinc-finger